MIVMKKGWKEQSKNVKENFRVGVDYDLNRSKMSSLLTFHQTLFPKLTEMLVNQLGLNECSDCCGRQVFAMRK